MRYRVGLIVLFLLSLLGTAAAAQDAARITKEEIRPLLESPGMVILDVRSGDSWTESDMKIKGAVREEPEKFASWADKYPKDKTFVLY